MRYSITSDYLSPSGSGKNKYKIFPVDLERILPRPHCWKRGSKTRSRESARHQRFARAKKSDPEVQL